MEMDPLHVSAQRCTMSIIILHKLVPQIVKRRDLTCIDNDCNVHMNTVAYILMPEILKTVIRISIGSSIHNLTAKLVVMGTPYNQVYP